MMPKFLLLKLSLALKYFSNSSSSIFQSGIKRLVYHKEYKDKSGIEFLKKAGLEISLIANL